MRKLCWWSLLRYRCDKRLEPRGWGVSIKSPQYLAECCVAVSELAGRQRLRSAQRRQLDVPRYQRSTFGRRAFSVAGPTVWNSLPNELKNATDEAFSRLLKHFCSVSTSVPSALEAYTTMRYINRLLHYIRRCGSIVAKN